MSWQHSLPRPTPSLFEWLTATRVAPVADRWRGVAQVLAHLPSDSQAASGRIYQLPYLDAQRQAAFAVGFAAGKLMSIRLLGKVMYDGVPWWLEVRSGLVSVYLVRQTNGDWRLLLGPCGPWGRPQLLPVPRGQLLLLRLLPSKLILR